MASRPDRILRPDQPAVRERTCRADPHHRRATHLRWVAHRNRDTGAPDYPEAWYAEQCGGCWFYVPLAGEYGSDWGACTNPKSTMDGRVIFEHDGCEHHHPAGDWVIADDGGALGESE